MLRILVPLDKGGNLIQHSPFFSFTNGELNLPHGTKNPEPRFQEEFFWRILVPRDRGGDLIQSPPFFSFTNGDSVKSLPERRTKMPGNLFGESWLQRKRAEILFKSYPVNQKPKIKIPQKTFLGILVFGSVAEIRLNLLPALPLLKEI